MKAENAISPFWGIPTANSKSVYQTDPDTADDQQINLTN